MTPHGKLICAPQNKAMKRSAILGLLSVVIFTIIFPPDDILFFIGRFFLEFLAIALPTFFAFLVYRDYRCPRLAKKLAKERSWNNSSNSHDSYSSSSSSDINRTSSFDYFNDPSSPTYVSRSSDY